MATGETSAPLQSQLRGAPGPSKFMSMKTKGAGEMPTVHADEWTRAGSTEPWPAAVTLQVHTCVRPLSSHLWQQTGRPKAWEGPQEPHRDSGYGGGPASSAPAQTTRDTCL